MRTLSTLLLLVYSSTLASAGASAFVPSPATTRSSAHLSPTVSFRSSFGARHHSTTSLKASITNVDFADIAALKAALPNLDPDAYRVDIDANADINALSDSVKSAYDAVSPYVDATAKAVGAYLANVDVNVDIDALTDTLRSAYAVVSPYVDTAAKGVQDSLTAYVDKLASGDVATVTGTGWGGLIFVLIAANAAAQAEKEKKKKLEEERLAKEAEERRKRSLFGGLGAASLSGLNSTKINVDVGAVSKKVGDVSKKVGDVSKKVGGDVSKKVGAASKKVVASTKPIVSQTKAKLSQIKIPEYKIDTTNASASVAKAIADFKALPVKEQREKSGVVIALSVAATLLGTLSSDDDRTKKYVSSNEIKEEEAKIEVIVPESPKIPPPTPPSPPPEPIIEPPAPAPVPPPAPAPVTIATPVPATAPATVPPVPPPSLGVTKLEETAASLAPNMIETPTGAAALVAIPFVALLAARNNLETTKEQRELDQENVEVEVTARAATVEDVIDSLDKESTRVDNLELKKSLDSVKADLEVLLLQSKRKDSSKDD